MTAGQEEVLPEEWRGLQGENRACKAKGVAHQLFWKLGGADM